MWKSIIYKEWLKIKWFVFIYAGIGILSVGNIFLKVQHDFTFNEATNYWYAVLFQNYQFYGYGLFKFIPVIGGLAVAIAQYFPETVNKRIKLTFHLPINENRILLIIMAFGATCISIVGALMFISFSALSLIFFPREIIFDSLISTAPWFLSGFAVYFLAALVVLEPVWKYRFMYMLVAVIFVPVYLETSMLGSYAPAIPFLAIFTVMISISLLFSGYRFRKGEM